MEDNSKPQKNVKANLPRLTSDLRNALEKLHSELDKTNESLGYFLEFLDNIENGKGKEISVIEKINFNEMIQFFNSPVIHKAKRKIKKMLQKLKS